VPSITLPHAQWDAEREEVNEIKISKKLLAVTAASAILVLSTVLVVSLIGSNDKPDITNDLPPADEQPPADEITDDVPSDTSDTTPTDDDGDEPTDEPDEPIPEEKTTGLEHAYAMHVRNIEKWLQNKGTDYCPRGLQHSMDKLELNLFKITLKQELKQVHGQSGNH
jgi:hypothetical protein